MRILVSNDDGIDAPGIRVLADVFAELGEVWTVAPATEQSARSHAISIHNPVRVSARGNRRFAVQGSPADAVYFGLHHFCPPDVALVVSGINRGPNLADDTWYSGTVAAAREGAMAGRMALAVSLKVTDRSRDETSHWAVAAQLALDVARKVLESPPAERTVYNLNVPDLPMHEQGSLKVCPLGDQHYRPSVHVAEDPRGGKIYWIGGTPQGFADQPGSDGHWVERGHPTLTPLHIRGTDMGELERLSRQFGEPTPS